MNSKKEILLDRLWFSTIPLEYLSDARIELVLHPYIGLQRVGFLEPLKIRFKIRRSLTLPTEREPGSQIAFYVASYLPNDNSGRLYYKVGSSSINSVLSRVYTQSPIAGVISTVVVVNERLNTETVDREIAKELKSRLKITVRSSRSKIKNTNIVNYHLTCLKTTKEINATYNHRIYSVLKEISNTISEVINKKFSQKLTIAYPSPTLVFTPMVKDDDINYLEKLDKTKSNGLEQLVEENKGLRIPIEGELTILHNALCTLKANDKNYIGSCDKVEYEFLIELVR